MENRKSMLLKQLQKQIDKIGNVMPSLSNLSSSSHVRGNLFSENPAPIKRQPGLR
jgi:hypothetical protein